ncbi:MAG: hypothetical protein J5824_07215, partial [Lachnospiraceae bacterium]|nr:hypothetical protein [Lachnospiraceae bacterium]
MSRINLKKPIALFLAAAMTMAQTIPAGGQSNYPENDELYFAALENEVVENVQTAQVRKGDFIVNAACKASIEYETISYVFNDISIGSVQFVEMLVSSGDTVNVGDPVAQVNVSVDSETVEQLEADIEALEEALESYINTNAQL